VDHHNGAFVGIDSSKLRNAIAVAEEGRGGDVRFPGEIDTTEAATRKRPNVIATAIARELSAFIWAINREVMAGR
jgi:transposase